MTTRWRLIAGTDDEFTFTVYDANGHPADISGASFQLLAKASVADADGAALISAAPTISGDGANGIVAVSIPAASTLGWIRTRTLSFEVLMTLAGKKRPVLDGYLIVRPGAVKGS